MYWQKVTNTKYKTHDVCNTMLRVAGRGRGLHYYYSMFQGGVVVMLHISLQRGLSNLWALVSDKK